MKRISLALLPLLVSCGADKIPDIPTLEVGGGGARFMTDAKTPFDAFNNAYSDLTRQHLNIRRNLNPSGNRYGMEAAAARIVRDLEIMKSVLVKPEPSTLDPYIEFYKEVHKLCQQGRLAGHYVTRLDQCEKEIKLRYAVDQIEVIDEFPKDEKSSKKDGAKTEKKEETKKDDLPPPKEKKDEENPPKDPPRKDETPRTDPPPAKDDGVTYRLLYKAWLRSHEDLCAAFKARKEAKERYDEVMEALRGMRKSLDAKRGERLQVYIAFYEKIFEDTRGFTAPPEGAKDEDVLNDLKIVSTGIVKDFDPARGK
ncbi:MAG: hypothetical protein HYY17_03300 [Planctomycetes bacterium]|nr:hypothetical protein [Planctomycetota bacterium]